MTGTARKMLAGAQTESPNWEWRPLAGPYGSEFIYSCRYQTKPLGYSCGPCCRNTCDNELFKRLALRHSQRKIETNFAPGGERLPWPSVVTAVFWP